MGSTKTRDKKKKMVSKKKSARARAPLLAVMKTNRRVVYGTYRRWRKSSIDY